MLLGRPGQARVQAALLGRTRLLPLCRAEQVLRPVQELRSLREVRVLVRR